MESFDLQSYDRYIVSFSGGKDSTACFLHLLENGIPKDKIELWHQDIDGRSGSFFDWEVTPDYCRKFAQAFGVKIYFQWKEGGFKREMLRENSLTAPNCFELQDGSIGRAGGTRGKLGTRLKFPQSSADLSLRWCSSYLKIDVCSMAIINQERFRNIKTLVDSGTPYPDITPNLMQLATNSVYTESIIIEPPEEWILPAGAFGENCGAM